MLRGAFWWGVLAVASASIALGAADPRPAMIGAPGTDADGYPLATADQRAALRLLRARRFDELDAWIVDLQTQFESDYHKEYWPIAALDAFDSADATLTPLLDEWVSKMPDSWAALAARGIHHVAFGWHGRGHKWASETPRENFQEMEARHVIAVPDLDEALARNPRLVAAHRALINVGKANSLSRSVMRGWLDDALSRCPDCFVVRVAFMSSLLPRWGGSYARMRAFASESARLSTNPRMRFLAGFVDVDRCDVLADNKDPRGAREACDAALAAGDYWEFRLRRAYLLRDAGHDREALAELDRAAIMRPQHTEILRLRVSLLKHLQAFERVAADVAVLKELDPTEGLKKGDVAWAAQGLAFEASQRRKAGHPDDELTLLRRAAAMQPDDLVAHLRLDAALSRARKLDEVVTMWTRYLARHPDDGRAHLERGGAFHHLGRESQAQKDVQAACQLGEQAACRYVRRTRD